MEVACTQCQARYQFDASAVPPGGYDAQCTGCGAVFFVAPEAAQPEETIPAPQPAVSQPLPEPQLSPALPEAPQQPESLVSTSCTHCGTEYQFPASAIPAQGYDAQCTQCQKVFFVSLSAASAGAHAAEPELLTKPRPRASDTLAPAQPAVEAQEPIELGRPKQPLVQPQAERPGSTAPALGVTATTASHDNVPQFVGDGDEADARDASDLMALSLELGEPAPSPSGVTLEDDFEQIIKRRRQRLTVFAVAVGLMAAYAGVTYVAVPRLFDLTIGKLVGVKLTVDPAAVPFVDRARARILDDTDGAYQEAIGLLNQALAVDPQYPEAMSLAGLALVFRGADIQARGREIYGLGARAIAEINALEELPASRRPPDLEARVTRLRADAGRHSEESTKLFEAGGKEMSAGAEMLRNALKVYQHVPFVAEASGIYYTTDRDSMQRAAEIIRYATELHLGAGATLDLKSPPDMWLPYLKGLVAAAERGDGAKEARPALESALAQEPRFQRARFALVEVLDRAGGTAQARKLAQEILAAVPDHRKAADFLGRAVEPTAAARPQPEASQPAASKAKKHKAKKRR